MRAALVVNPAARDGAHPPHDIRRALAACGVETALVSVEAGLAPALRAALATCPDAIIVGGGDGTISSAAAALCDHTTPTPLGVLPLGTANDFARTLGIPRDLEQACALIGAGHTVAVDVGVANGRHFLNVASIGWPATVSSALSDELKARWGVLAYPLAALRAALRQRPFTATLTIDGRQRRVRQVVQIAVGSGRYYGGGMQITDTAEPTDGYLHLHVITAPTAGALLWTLRHLRSGRYAQGDSALRVQARRVRITTRRRLRINVDGELRGFTPLEVEVHPRCLPVFAPPSTDERSAGRDRPAGG